MAPNQKKQFKDADVYCSECNALLDPDLVEQLAQGKKVFCERCGTEIYLSEPSQIEIVKKAKTDKDNEFQRNSNVRAINGKSNLEKKFEGIFEKLKKAWERFVESFKEWWKKFEADSKNWDQRWQERQKRWDTKNQERNQRYENRMYHHEQSLERRTIYGRQNDESQKNPLPYVHRSRWMERNPMNVEQQDQRQNFQQPVEQKYVSKKSIPEKPTGPIYDDYIVKFIKNGAKFNPETGEKLPSLEEYNSLVQASREKPKILEKPTITAKEEKIESIQKPVLEKPVETKIVEEIHAKKIKQPVSIEPITPLQSIQPKDEIKEISKFSKSKKAGIEIEGLKTPIQSMPVKEERDIYNIPGAKFDPQTGELLKKSQNQEKSEHKKDLRVIPDMQKIDENIDVRIQDEYSHQIFTVLSPRIRERISKLEISEEQLKPMLESFVFLSESLQWKYLEELEGINRSSSSETLMLIEKIKALSISEEQKQILIKQLEYLIAEKQKEFVDFVEGKIDDLKSDMDEDDSNLEKELKTEQNPTKKRKLMI